MSLLVHLPLLGDLKNIGLAGDVTVINHGATVNNSGKLGPCYEFSGSTYIDTGFAPSFGEGDFSIAMWVKIVSDTTKSYQGLISCKTSPAASAGCAIYWNHTHKRFLWSTGNGTNATEIWTAQTFDDSAIYEKWNHIVMVRNSSDPKVGYFYINGERYELTSIPVIRNVTTTGTCYLGNCRSLLSAYYYTGLMNDVRIYDHALSDREVKELAKGLVAHWKLDENISVLNNAYNYPTFDTSVATGGWFHWGYSGHQGSYAQNTDKQYIYNKSQTYSHMISNGASASAGANYLVYQNPAFEGGYRSLQCICKEVNGAQIDESIFYPAWNARDGGAAPNKWTSITPLGDGFYLCKCEGIHQNGSNDLIGFYVTVGNTVYISEAYCENDKEVCSDIFWQDEIGTIHDSSGYCHDGTLSPTPPTFDSDSARYSGCMKFSSNYIHCGLSSLYPTDEISVCWWGYMSTWGASRPISCTETGGWNFEQGDGGGWRFPVYKNGIGYVYSVPAKKWTDYTSGWHFFVGTFDGYVSRIYVDGELDSTSTNGSPTVKAAIMYRANVPIYIGCEANGANPYTPYFNGKLSDIRIYATALSADDIKELYNTSASIDNHHNVYAREFVED